MQYFLVNKKLERKRAIPYSIHVKIVRHVFLMLIFSLNILIVQASNQSITLKFQKAKLNRVLEEISNQTKFQFFYNDQINQVTGPITIELSGATITQVLDKILPKNKLEYQITESQITINLRTTNRSNSNVQSQEYIEGSIKDINGVPLVGASIKDKR
ncbi:STN domain-containing protein [Sphingobacterium endophyticum]|uniref:STN domain-containing protein n=1 Tax=Sphingobacterium endophyticum TaxID=2546448 RepID=UPI0012E27C07|nr:STN domain-containing protein [Sphingobacterium endophyticum]